MFNKKQSEKLENLLQSSINTKLISEFAFSDIIDYEYYLKEILEKRKNKSKSSIELMDDIKWAIEEKPKLRKRAELWMREIKEDKITYIKLLEKEIFNIKSKIKSLENKLKNENTHTQEKKEKLKSEFSDLKDKLQECDMQIEFIKHHV